MTPERDPVVVLLVDPDPDRREATASVLEDDPPGAIGDSGGSERVEFTVVTEPDTSSARRCIESRDVDCIVSDDELPDGDALAFHDDVHEDDQDVPFVLYTDTDAGDIAPDAYAAGVDDIVQKNPGTGTDLVLRNRVRDLVERSRTLRDIERTEPRYRRLIEESTDAIVVVDEHGTYQFVSPVVEEMWGYTPAELVGERGFEYVHPDDRERLQEVFAELVADPGESVTAEYRTKLPDGSWQWTGSRARNMLDDDEIEGIVIYSRDITEQKRRERELREERAIVRGIIDTIPDIVFAFDEHGDPIRDDLILSDVPGYTEDELRENHPLSFVREEDRAELADAISRILEEGAVEAQDTALVLGSGEEVPHRVIASRLTDETGRVLGVVGTAHDISDRVERERELERQIERLDEFADIVSHDLRNPLTVAKGRRELAHEETERESVREHLDAVANAHDRMEGLVEGLLRLARDGDAEVTQEPVRLDEFAENCWENVRSPGATVDIETDAVVLADQRRLRQLFENLFRNAVEHGSTSPDSGTHQDAEEHGSTSPDSQTRQDAEEHGDDVTVTVGELDDGFFVADDGPGIPEEWCDDLFDSGVSSKEDGTGFGLYIVDQIAADHGWSVRAADSESGGARFEVTGVEFV